MFDFKKNKNKLNKEIIELKKTIAAKENILVKEGRKDGDFVLTTDERTIIDSELKRIKERNPRLAASLDCIEGWKLILQARGSGIPNTNTPHGSLNSKVANYVPEDDNNMYTPDVILSGTSNSSGIKTRADALRAGQLSEDKDTGAAILEIAAT